MTESAGTTGHGGTLRAPFHYRDGERETRANLLVQHLQLGEQVVVLEGDPGSGRTHLLRHLLARDDHGLKVYAVHAEPGLALADLLLGMLEHLRLPPPPTDAPARIRSHALERLTAMTRNGEMPVLAIDDADALDDDLLAGLVSLRRDARTEDGHPPGLLLVGSSRLALRVAEHTRDDPREGTVTVALHGLEMAGTRAFLLDALRADGDASGTLLASVDIDAVQADSGGRPGDILEAARRQLAGEATAPVSRRVTGGGASGLSRVGSRRRIAVAAAGLAVALAAAATGMVALMPVGDEPVPSTGTDEAVERPTLAAADANEGGEEPAAEESAADDRAADEPAPSAVGSDPPAAPATGREGPPEPEPDRNREPAEPAPDAGDPEPVGTADGGDAAGDPPVADDGVGTGGTPDETDAVAGSQESESPDAGSDGDGGAAASNGSPVEAEPTPLEAALTAGREWRRAQGEERWTIQLIAAHDAAAVVDWMEANAVEPPMHLVRTQRDGRDWYVVVTGAAADRAAARERLEALPPELREDGAWIRSLDGL